MSRRIPLPRIEGEVSRQAHADLPPGTVEREIGREGFYGPATHMYHQHPPTGWTGFDGPLRPHALRTSGIKSAPDPWGATRLLHSPRLQLRFWRTEESMADLARNADGDELFFVHEGEAELFCDYGHLSLCAGDYLLLPRGTLWRIETPRGLSMLMIEATGSGLHLPERGLLGAHALFDPAVLETPHIDEPFRAQYDESAWRVRVKARGAHTTLHYPFNPLDAVGWKGELAPVRLHTRDLRPVMSPRYHLPPSVHSTFQNEHFVVCTFCPRPLESDPDALKLPFFHSNDDYDEVIFYHAGSFMSRDAIGPGMLSYHPAGFTHGPHPEALRRAQENPRRETDEIAVMIDAREPLELADGAETLEDPGYAGSWSGSA